MMAAKFSVYLLMLLTFIVCNPASGETDLENSAAPFRESPQDISLDDGFFYRKRRDAPGNETTLVEAVASALSFMAPHQISSAAEFLQAQINSNLDYLTYFLSNHYSFETPDNKFLASLVSIKNTYIQKLFETLTLAKVRSSRFLNQIVAEAQLNQARTVDDGQSDVATTNLIGDVFGLLGDFPGGLITNLLGVISAIIENIFGILGVGNLLGQLGNVVVAVLVATSVNLAIPIVLGMVVQVLNSTTGLGVLLTNNIVAQIIKVVTMVISIGTVTYLVNAVSNAVSVILGS